MYPFQLISRLSRSRSGGSLLAANTRGKWMALIGAMWLLANTGLAYTFAIYSPALKEELGYNQKEMNYVGVAKDIGNNVGLLAGFIYPFMPPWASIALGALQHLIGYGSLWLVVSKYLPQPPLLQVMASMYIGVNSGTYFNTAALLVCVHNFPNSRGPAVGLLKGMVGLSGAIYSQLYAAFYAPKRSGFLFLATGGPFIAAMSVLFLLKPYPQGVRNARTEEEEKSNFNLCFICLSLLVSFLLLITTIGSLSPMGRSTTQIMVLGIFILLALPLIIPLQMWISNLNEGRFSDEEQRGLLERGKGENDSENFGLDTNAKLGTMCDQLEPHELEIGLRSRFQAEAEKEPLILEVRQVIDVIKTDKVESENDNTEFQLNKADNSEQKMRSELKNANLKCKENESKISQKLKSFDSKLAISLEASYLRENLTDKSMQESELSVSPKGDAKTSKKDAKVTSSPVNLTLFEAMKTLNFWLAFFSMLCGAGTGLTTINNLAQIGQAQKLSSQQIVFSVALVSVWNCSGRVGGGFCSEYLVRHRRQARPIIIAWAQGLMAIGHLMFAFALPGSMYIGSLIVGSCYGIIFSMFTASLSEIFGLAHFAMIYNFFTMANPLGSCIFSAIAGYFYDKLVEENGVLIAQQPVRQCLGAKCFRTTFLIMAGMCVLGMFSTFLLSSRTKGVYELLYKQPKKVDEAH